MRSPSVEMALRRERRRLAGKGRADGRREAGAPSEGRSESIIALPASACLVSFLFLGGLLASVLLSGLGTPAHARTPDAIPHPDVSAFEAPVAEQIRAARAALDATLDDAEASPEERVAAYGRLGRIYHAYDLSRPAIASYRRAVELAPAGDGGGPWRYLLGVLLRREGDLDAAAETLRRVLAEDSADADADLVRAHLASVELDRRRFDAAEELAREVLESVAASGRSPSGEIERAAGLLAPAHWVLGRLAVERGDPAVAVEHFERVLELQPGAGQVRYALAQALRRLGRRDEAMEHLAKRNAVGVSFDDPYLAAVRAEVEGPSALRQRAAMELAAGREDLGLELYRRALELAPESADAHRDLASVLAGRGEDAAAADLYRRAADLEPERPLNHAALGILLSRTGRHGEAVASLQRAHELAPSDRTVRALLAREHAAVGQAAAQAGDGERAVEHLRAAVALDDDLPTAHFALANVLGARRELAEAARHYRRVTELVPEEVGAWLGLATALHLSGRSHEAAETLRRAIAIRGPDPALERTLAALEEALAGSG